MSVLFQEEFDRISITKMYSMLKLWKLLENEFPASKIDINSIRKLSCLFIEHVREIREKFSLFLFLSLSLRRSKARSRFSGLPIVRPRVARRVQKGPANICTAACLACCSPAKMFARVRVKEQFGIKPELEERSPWVAGGYDGPRRMFAGAGTGGTPSLLLVPPLRTANEISRDEVRDQGGRAGVREVRGGRGAERGLYPRMIPRLSRAGFNVLSGSAPESRGRQASRPLHHTYTRTRVHGRAHVSARSHTAARSAVAYAARKYTGCPVIIGTYFNEEDTEGRCRKNARMQAASVSLRTMYECTLFKFCT